MVAQPRTTRLSELSLPFLTLTCTLRARVGAKKGRAADGDRPGSRGCRPEPYGGFGPAATGKGEVVSAPAAPARTDTPDPYLPTGLSPFWLKCSLVFLTSHPPLRLRLHFGGH